MDRDCKKAITRNRVRLLNLDYIDLTGPLLASEVLSTRQHKIIKTQATENKGRVDLLLEWLEESAPKEAFQQLLQGIRNCEDSVLARKIKKEAGEGGKLRLNVINPVSKSLTEIAKPISATSTLSPLATLNQVIASSSTPDKKVKPKIKKESKPTVGGPTTPTVPFNGLPANIAARLTLSVKGKTPKKQKSATDKVGKTPENLNKTPKPSASGSTDVKVVALATKTKKQKPVAVSSSPAAATPRATRKSSGSEKGEDGAAPKAKKQKILKPKETPGNVQASSSPKPKGVGKGPAKPMTFKQVEVKQQDSRQKFKFKNSEAVTKMIHFKDKTDISYLGCPFEENGKICEKKVELKSKEFVCDSRHRSPNCKQIPRLNITCYDGTADLQLILLKNNVENFCGKSTAELGSQSVNEIKDALDRAIGKKLTVEVICEKAKKATKKAGVPKWDNVATLLPNSDGPPAKKKRKV